MKQSKGGKQRVGKRKNIKEMLDNANTPKGNSWLKKEFLNSMGQCDNCHPKEGGQIKVSDLENPVCIMCGRKIEVCDHTLRGFTAGGIPVTVAEGRCPKCGEIFPKSHTDRKEKPSEQKCCCGGGRYINGKHDKSYHGNPSCPKNQPPQPSGQECVYYCPIHGKTYDRDHCQPPQPKQGKQDWEDADTNPATAYELGRHDERILQEKAIQSAIHKTEKRFEEQRTKWAFKTVDEVDKAVKKTEKRMIERMKKWMNAHDEEYLDNSIGWELIEHITHSSQKK